MGAIKDLWQSERGLLAALIIIGATVLAAMSIMTVDQWTSFVQVIFGTYVIGKTVTGAVEIAKGRPAKETTTTTVAADGEPVVASTTTTTTTPSAVKE